jgi:subtilisin family serine protease
MFFAIQIGRAVRRSEFRSESGLIGHRTVHNKRSPKNERYAASNWPASTDYILPTALRRESGKFVVSAHASPARTSRILRFSKTMWPEAFVRHHGQATVRVCGRSLPPHSQPAAVAPPANTNPPHMPIRATFRATFVVALLIAGLTKIAHAQDRSPADTWEVGGTTITMQSSFAGESLPDASFDPSASGRYIVTFTAPALAGSSEKASKAMVDDQHARFRTDFGIMGEAAAKRGESSENVIRHEYHTVLNGVSITTRADLAIEIAQLEYVASVTPDGEVRALDQASNAVIGAARAHAELGLSGQGIKVAVLDTGIDYTHPGLGGGLGEGFKVVGGYNFAEENADPMDRHGHGTHVAGIIAGNDGADFIGVAPAATLLAYKVLGDGGSGLNSWVIAAIERAVTDGAHIMNLSLGGSGHADDPVSQAIDNATLAGVLCVVAAGNDGTAYSINSPGTARRALTVGATNNSDELATFSSRGPSNITFGSKPDIVAPGVAISSSIPGDRFAAFSGTSMAAPHVAGAAALLRERHPSWTARDLKSALTHSATDLGLSTWRQGSGRLDIMAAERSVIAMDPVSLSFGNLDPAQPVVQSSQNVVLKNLSGSPQNWSVSVSHSIPGATITVSPANVSLAPGGGTATVSVTARFETAQLAFPSSIDMPYAGSIIVNGPAVSRIPITVTKTPQLTIDFDVSPFSVDVIGLQSGHARALTPGNLASFPLASGTYDVIMSYLLPEGNNIVRGFAVREQIAISGRHTISARRADLKNEVVFNSRDRHGSAMAHDYALFSLERMSSSTAHDYSHGIALDAEPRVLLSDLSSRFKIEALLTNLGGDGNDAYVLPFGRIGLNSTLTMTSNWPSYRSVQTQFEVPTSVEELFIVQRQIRNSTSGFMTMSSGYSTDRADRHRRSWPFTRTVHYGARPYEHFGYRYASYEVFDSSIENLPNWDSPTRLWQSPLIEATPEETRFFAQIDFQEPLRTSTDPVIEETYGQGPVSYDGRMWNLGTISLHRLSSQRYGLFSGSHHETVAGEVTYRLSAENGSVVSEGTAPIHFLPGPFTSPAGIYTFEATLNGGFVDDHRVRAVAKSLFDSRYEDGLYDPDPPMITSLYLTTDGQRTTSFEVEGDHALVAYIKDTYNQGGPVVRNVADASIAVRGLLESDWTSLSTARSGHRFTAPIADSLAAGYYDLRIVANDLGGNSLDYVVEPAFRNGVLPETSPQAAILTSPADLSFIRLNEVSGPVEFRWESGSGVRHAFRLTGGDLDTTMAAIGGSISIEAQGLLEEGHDYEWYVASTDGFTIVESSRFIIKARGTSVSNDDDAELPRSLALLPAYPNPFNPTTNLTFTLPTDGVVLLEVFDLLGRRVDVLLDRAMPAGRHEHRWNASGHSSGVYLVRLTSGSHSQVQRVVLMK